ncbi:hypothetical protein [Pseudomonas sp. R5(2019)]|uniref:hypothetical protein n=1 Tax=Pseudomonas sp. R5(2019) TaxID=2697566 RepID=UPI00141250EA|nr:hypothetical protein [Pseudomonas sp. R5(2019)]NBA96841.1 hypothetical protein [Pseudomonas sp. R5(2019)]
MPIVASDENSLHKDLIYEFDFESIPNFYTIFKFRDGARESVSLSKNLLSGRVEVSLTGCRPMKSMV